MKNLKKLTKKELKSISGSKGDCPTPAQWCSEWCSWTPWQRQTCINWLIDPDPCPC